LPYPLGDAHASGARDSLNLAVFGVPGQSPGVF
jgi:hypothetical protein